MRYSEHSLGGSQAETVALLEQTEKESLSFTETRTKSAVTARFPDQGS